VHGETFEIAAVMARAGARRKPLAELPGGLERLLRMTPEVLFALSAFALVGGRVLGGIQWHHWNRRRRRAGSMAGLRDESRRVPA